MSAQIISSLLIFAVGIGIGVLLQRYVLSRGTHVSLLEKELDTLKGEQLQIKDTLQQHFTQTADLTHDLTNSYKALYDHLASGASQFTEKPLTDLERVLEQVSKDSLSYNDTADLTEKQEPSTPKDYATTEESVKS